MLTHRLDPLEPSREEQRLIDVIARVQDLATRGIDDATETKWYLEEILYLVNKELL